MNVKQTADCRREVGPIVLLMTVTVAPRGCPGAMFSTAERLEQYKRAFCFYVSRLSADVARGYNKLIFCDNSGFDLSCFRELIPDQSRESIEILSLPPTEFLPERGKGYNEEKLIEMALTRSRFLTDGTDPFVVKVTGRYSILNIQALVKQFRRTNPDFHVDIKDHKLYSCLGLRWTERYSDTRLLGFRVSFFEKHIKGRYEELNDSQGRPLEWQFFNIYREVHRLPRMSFRNRYDLFIDGINAHEMRVLSLRIPMRYQKHVGYVRSMIGSMVRLAIPWFWF